MTHGRSCLIGDDIYPGAQLSRLMASPERSSDDDDNTPCLGPSRSVRALASGRGNAATKVKSMPTALHYSSGRALPTRLVSTRRPIFTFRMEPVRRSGCRGASACPEGEGVVFCMFVVVHRLDMFVVVHRLDM